MTDAASTAGSGPFRSALYKSEMRFGVVMYGGVSLAIYINGVANELYEMACATPKVGENAAVSGTRRVYRKASLRIWQTRIRIPTPSPIWICWLRRSAYVSWST
jgi:hypothetical protein